jgi:hypothetical protein
MHMSHHLAGAGIALLLGAVAAGAQDGAWNVAGSASFVARYEGQVVRGERAFTLRVDRTADGTYTIVGTNPVCGSPDGPAVTLQGRFPGPERAFLGASVRSMLAATVRSCGGGVHVRALATRLRVAPDRRTLGGRFSVVAVLRFPLADETQTIRTTAHGHFTGSRGEEAAAAE